MQEIIGDYIRYINKIIWDPIVILFVLVGTIATISLKFVQFRFFFKSWKLSISPNKINTGTNDNISQFQAFINALSTSIGNGSLAGMATAIHEGGPGAALWIFILGIFALPIRFCEVYLSTAYSDNNNPSDFKNGGPMMYIKKTPGGLILSTIYAIFCLLLAFVAGDAVQVNSISCGLRSIFNINIYIIAIILFLFVFYIMFGGAKRIINFSTATVPLKVFIFFTASIILLLYNSKNLINAIKIIITSAFEPQAIKGAIIGTTMQSAIRFGLSRSVNASEAGIGIAAIFFGSTNKNNPVENGIMSMVSAFISNYLVCFLLALLVVLTGVWNHDATGIVLTTSAFATLYGNFANWLITFLSIIFGISVLVGYAYVGLECWKYLTNNKYIWLYSLTYILIAFLGAIAKVQLVWDAIDLVNAGLMIINLYAILILIPKIKIAINIYISSSK